MSELAQVLRHVTAFHDPRALVRPGDDAAVYLLDERRALVVTTDFFTPIVDDPYDFGRIAAANALSDLYAMGARPLFALNIVAFPRAHLEENVLGAIVRGGAEKAAEAGIAILGGHSIDDPEPKYGLVAVGEVDPHGFVAKQGARPGDRLVLTKAIGTGVVSTAIKAGAASAEVVAAAVQSMVALNRGAAEAMAAVGCHAATDVTGFGLLGHLREVLQASGVAAVVDAGAVPLLPGARDLAAARHVPGGTNRNRADLAGNVEWAPQVDEVLRTLLCDAQTSGGLLMAVAPERTGAMLEALAGRAPVAAVIGEVVEGKAGTIRVQ